MKKLIYIMVVTGILAAPDRATSVVNEGIDDTAKLPYWEFRQDAVILRLVQRLPDQTRGFFEARGFNKQDAEIIAQSCVFQTIIKNGTNENEKIVIEYNLAEWQIKFQHEPVKIETGKLLTREHWLKIWNERGISNSARIAFEWSLIPTTQRYQAQDYNWGMTMFGLKPGSEFNLHLSWHENGKKHSGTIKKIKCAEDIHPEPGESVR